MMLGFSFAISFVNGKRASEMSCLLLM